MFVSQVGGKKIIQSPVMLDFGFSSFNIRQNNTDCLMSGVTPETKKPPFLAVFLGFEPVDSPYRNI
jgi:hypothetical protein